MRGAPEKYAAMGLVFAAGLCAAVYGVVMLVLSRHVGPAAAQAAGGLALIGWVIFHPARAAEPAG